MCDHTIFQDSLFELLPSPVYVKKLDGQYITCNQKFSYTLFGLPKEQIIGKTLFDFPEHISHERAIICKKNDDYLLESKVPQEYDAEILCADKKIRCFHFNKTIFEDKKGSAAGILGIMTDITEIHRHQQEKCLFNKRISDTSRQYSLNSLADKIVRNFSEKLSAIYGYASMLQSLETDNTKKIILSNIIDVNQSASQLSEKLLLFSHQGPEHVQPIDINSIAEELCIKTQYHNESKFTVSFLPEKRLAQVYGDPQLISKILDTIIENAIEAINTQGTITVKTSNITCSEKFLSAHPDAEFPEYVCIEMTNTGSAIPPDMTRRIFEPFVSTKSSSRGLGLAIARSIVLSHSGIIECESENNITTFRLYFPHAINMTTISDNPSPVILVIDDDPMVLEIINEMLSDEGYTPLLASSGIEALSVLETTRQQISLIILDFMMPTMDGKTTFNNINHLYPHIPVVLSTGAQNDSRIEELCHMGIRDVLNKPYSSQKLAETIQKILEKNP